MPLIRKPEAADRAAALTGGNRQAAGSANQVRMLLVRDLEASKRTADRIYRTVTQGGGKGPVKGALGADGNDLDTIYAALKTYILALDPTADVPDLP